MTLSPYDMEIVNRICDDFMRQFPVIEGFEYEDKIKEIIHRHIHDVITTLRHYYIKEAEYAGERIANENEPIS